MVKVKVFSTLRDICGKEFVIDAANVKELLKESKKKYGKKFANQTKGVSILVNGKNISYMDGMETELKAADEVALLPPAAGG
jgi:molybdopterin synthase sulfur carrier subunit